MGGAETVVGGAVRGGEEDQGGNMVSDITSVTQLTPPGETHTDTLITINFTITHTVVAKGTW